MYTKAIQFVTLDSGCYIPLSHRLNADGYFRKRWKDELEMFHRFIWRAHHGDIPEGHEINHLCGCRSCANVKHMECITGTEHTIKTNQDRYVERQQLIVSLIEAGKTVEEMMKITGRDRNSIYSYRSRYNKGKLPIQKH